MDKTSLFFLLFLALLPTFQTHSTRCVHNEKKTPPIIPHPGQEETDGRILTSSDWESIRIVPYYYVDNASDRVQTKIQQQILPAVIAYYEAALKVKRLTAKIAMPDYLTYYCADVYSNSALKSGVNADLVLLVTGSSEPSEPYIAYAGACTVEKASYRPITGRVNFNYYYGFSSDSDVNYQSQLYTILHEIGHVLGFSDTLYEHFIDPDTLVPLSSPTMTKTVNGESITILTLDPLTNKLRDYFACSTLEGAYLEQQGGEGSAGSHFERRVFLNEFMTASDITDPRVSEFFLALLEGTGWYSPDYSMAEPMLWGKGQGCDFLETKCIDSSHQTDFPGYFCDTLGVDSCSFGDQAYGFCGTPDPTEKATTMDSNFDYWGDKTEIYDSFSDNCPYWISYTGTECRDDTNEAVNLPNGEIFGEQSSCFTGTLGNFVAKGSDAAFCFKKYCEEVTTGQYQVIVTVGDLNITCTSQQSVTVSGYQGVLNCPDPNTFCTTSALAYCPRGCMGRGTCTNNQCVCKDGYYGIDCGYQVITYEEPKKKITAIIIGAAVGGLALVSVATFVFFKVRAKRLKARRVSTLENQQPGANQSAIGMSSFQPIQNGANSQYYYPNQNMSSYPQSQRGVPVWFSG